MDGQVGIESGETRIPVEHHDDALRALRPSRREASAGGDADRPADGVQGHGVAGTEHLNARNAGNDLAGEGQSAPRRDPIQDAQGAVVEGGIAPDEEGADLPFPQLREGRFQPLGAGGVPRLDGRAVIGGVPLAGRVVHADEAVGAGDMRRADPLADRHEIGGLGPLVEDEHGGHVGQRPHRLQRQVLGLPVPMPTTRRVLTCSLMSGR